MQTILSVLLLLGLVTPEFCFAYTYPIFGTKRFQRGQPPQYQMAPSLPVQYQYQAPPQQYYSGPDMYDSEFYYQQPRRESGNYFGMPTYHGEYKPTPYYYAHGPSYSYTDERDVNSNPMDDLHEEMLQEDAIDRGEYGPVGQEIWYESPGHSSDSLAKANAAFLHNLMLYQKQFGGPKMQGIKDFDIPSTNSNNNPSSSNYEYDYDEHGISDWYDTPSSPSEHQQSYHKNVISPSSSSSLYNDDDTDELSNDKEVKELKALVNKHRKEHDSLYANSDWNQNAAYSPAEYDDPEYEDAWINWDSKRSTAPKKVLPKSGKKPTQLDSKKKQLDKVSVSKIQITTQKPVVSDKTSKSNGVNGQKEVVLPRPASPVKHPFQTPPFNSNLPLSQPQIMEAKKQLSSQKPHSSGAIYDTIKQILRMEQNLDKEQQHVQQKRYVSNEGSLVHELNGLKRHAANKKNLVKILLLL
uniref:CSON002107 protein n=2 Tax=Culicoides sonorensis TaxID=179676 RepID=A0A336K6F4_CULSO